MARLTGLEPAALGVTGRYSNQLSYNRNIYGLSGEIRTPDPLDPNQMRYQTALQTDLRCFGAPTRTRTADPLITNQMLYQLSYKGTNIKDPIL